MGYSPGADHRPVAERSYPELVESENEALATNWNGQQEVVIQVFAAERNRRDDAGRGGR